MVQTIKEILQDDNGRMSSMRVICILCIVMAIVRCFMDCGVPELSLWIGAAAGGKAAQKPFETKGIINANPIL